MAIYEPAPQLGHLAKPLIANHHQHLLNTRVEWVFRDTAGKQNGKTVMGRTRIIKGLAAMIATPGAQTSEDNDFFLIEIAADVWDVLSPDRRMALLDHELSHCFVEIADAGEIKLRLAPHDIEEFRGVVARHGDWLEDIEEFLAAFGKKKLESVAQTLPGIA